MRKFFINGKTQETQAYYGWQDKNTALIGVKKGYKDSADELIKIVLKEGLNHNIRIQDTYIFPIVFLYRHCLEVSMKAIYMRWCGKILPGGHSLIDLWNNLYSEVILEFDKPRFIEDIKKFKTNYSKYSLNHIDYKELKKMFNEFSKINDSKADVFRYLIDKKGNLYFDKNEFVDYPNLRDSMNYVYEILDYIYDITDEYLSGN